MMSILLMKLELRHRLGASFKIVAKQTAVLIDLE